ncbi:BTAD domain-containing putative transcriptional regulator [Plantactinospora sp. DSM 117369]
MQFGILGPVEVRHDGRLLPSGSGRERLVLASLLLGAGKVLPADVLITRLWEQPPGSARAQLHNLISGLRRRFRAVDPDLIETRPTGYLLRLRGHRLDLTEFRDLADRGRAAASGGDHTAAVALLDQALALWRGPALADVAGVDSGRLREALHGERLGAAEAKLDAVLGLAEYEAVLREVEPLLADNPYAERLYCQQMSALAGLGRRAEALAVYRRAYRRFVDGLGLEPGPLLRATQQRILLGEPVAGAGTERTRPVPRQLPPAPALTGRESLLDRVLGQMTTADPACAPVVLLTGPGGVGKSALALAAGHRLGAAFPDGQLYADLRGSHDTPGDPYRIVERLLRALGVAGGDVPDDPEERVTLYRSHLARGRMLVVLDDAADEAQLRPLLPGSAGSGAVVTSRRHLAAMLGAARVPVPALSTEDAVRLLTEAVGEARIAAEPEAAREISRLCGGLPLALCIAAARLAVRPEETVDELRQRLAVERGRLDELAVGDLDVRASIALSYRALPAEARRLVRRLGLLSTTDSARWAAQALLDTTDGRARALLHQLADVHLVEPLGRDAVGQQRYRLHDLVAEYARERLMVDDEPADREQALARLLRGWLDLAGEADELLGTPEAERNRETGPMVSSGQRALRADPLAWFETERAGLVAAVGQAGRANLPDLAGGLALRLSGFLRLRSYDDDLEHMLRLALSCVPTSGADPLRARLLGELFAACLGRDRYAELPAIAADQLAVARRIDDPQLLVRALTNSGLAALRAGPSGEAFDWLARAVSTARDLQLPGHLRRDALATLGFAYWEMGDPGRAVPLLAEALAVSDAPIPPLRDALHRYHYGLALTDTGELSGARQALAEAMEVSVRLRDDLGTAYLEQALADVDIREGRLPEAARRLDRALAGHEALGHRDGLAETLRSLGDLAAAEGRWADAEASLRRALELYRRIGARPQAARVLARLDRVSVAVGDGGAAAGYRVRWRAILDGLSLAEAALQLPPFLDR